MFYHGVSLTVLFFQSSRRSDWVTKKPLKIAGIFYRLDDDHW